MKLSCIRTIIYLSLFLPLLGGFVILSGLKARAKTITVTNVLDGTAEAVEKAGYLGLAVEETSWYAYREPEDAYIEVKAHIQQGADYTLKEIIADTNTNIFGEDSPIDTKETGDYRIIITYEYEGDIYKGMLNYTVSPEIDNEAPIIFKGPKSINVPNGKAFDIDAYVSYGDYIDAHPSLTYTGSVNTAVNGSYPLKITVSDASGNAQSWNCTVNVYTPSGGGGETPDTRARTQFEDFKLSHPGENYEYGIDVSKWQGNIDFDAVKAAGCDFVMMRISRYDGELIIDPYFERNFTEAKRVGMKVGVYMYTTDVHENELRSHIDFFMQALNGREVDFPIVFDWESWGRFQQYGVSIRELNRMMDVFENQCEKYGYTAMLYGSKNYLNLVWDVKDRYPVWLAHYTANTDYAGDYIMWQASSTGKIPGIAGDVDLDIYYRR